MRDTQAKSRDLQLAIGGKDVFASKEAALLRCNRFVRVALLRLFFIVVAISFFLPAKIEFARNEVDIPENPIGEYEGDNEREIVFDLIA